MCSHNKGNSKLCSALPKVFAAVAVVLLISSAIFVPVVCAESFEITSPNILPGAIPGVFYNYQLETNKVGATWTLLAGSQLPPGLTLRTDGLIRGAPYRVGEYSFGLEARHAGQTRSQTFTITVGLRIDTFKLPWATENIPYSFQMIASGGRLPYVWSLSPTSDPALDLSENILPPGMVFSKDGVFSGSVSESQKDPYEISFRVTDSLGYYVDKEFEFYVDKVSAPSNPVEINTPNLPPAKKGFNYSSALEFSGGFAPYTWSVLSGTLPQGMELREGVLSGTPNKSGLFLFVIGVEDSRGYQGSKKYELTVEVTVTSVTLDKSIIFITTDDQFKLHAEVYPSNATQKNIRWESNNTKVASVDADGKVTALSPGIADINVTTEDGGKKALCRVIVVEATDKTPVMPMVATGENFSLALRSDTSALSWGHNQSGQLGSGTVLARMAPEMLMEGIVVTFLAAGQAHGLALDRDGNIWAWGNNRLGQLGLGNAASQVSTPQKISNTAELTAFNDVTAFAAGGNHSLAVRNNGSVWAWGDNNSGQLGNMHLVTHHLPVPVPGLWGVSSVAAGLNHSLALKTDGTAWAWGDNSSGQLGNGSSTNSATPHPVTALTGITALAAGSGHSLALKDDGTVWAWGSNSSGQLGTGSLTDSSFPAMVRGLSGVRAIAAGHSHSLALKEDGTVWAWGNNHQGQLGSFLHDQLLPVRVPGISMATALAAGDNHSLALCSDGSLWGWGGNDYGQLGTGTQEEYKPAPSLALANLGEQPSPWALNVQEWSPKRGVSYARTWRIDFSSSPDPATVSSDTIIVTEDIYGLNRVPGASVDVDSSRPSRVLVKPPPQWWAQGKTYYLFITNEVKSLNGHPLTRGIRMQFRIAE